MKLSEYKSYDDLPLFLNAEMVAKVLGVSPSSGYELLHEDGFPVLRVGNRMVVPKTRSSGGWSHTQEVADENTEQLLHDAQRSVPAGTQRWGAGGITVTCAAARIAGHTSAGPATGPSAARWA